MEAQEQNKMLNITKFVGLGNYNECYINSNHVRRIFKSTFNDYYSVDVGGSITSLYNVKTKEQLNEFLDYIYSK